MGKGILKGCMTKTTAIPFGYLTTTTTNEKKSKQIKVKLLQNESVCYSSGNFDNGQRPITVQY